MPGRGAHARSGRKGPFRKDIQGLRAVAIVAVVGYHAAVPHMGGGYVGVDVFFVISGYLITGLLARELREHRSLSFARFYARRARRILPSAVLVVVATAGASIALWSPLRAASVLRDGIASALYVANYRYAIEATSYLTRGGAPSPFLHYWSLGVEEQFYLLWPGLLVLATFAWRRHAGRRAHGPGSAKAIDRAALAALLIVGAVSLGLGIWLTQADEPWAFYSLGSRAWELAGGGVLALVEPSVAQLPSPVAPILGWSGVAAIAYAVVAFSSSTPFPGTAALVPVGGAMAVVAAGSVGAARLGPASLLALRPCQAIGAVSYTWYLWHWPALVLAPAVLGHRLGLGGRLGASGVGLVLAIATTVAVERPLWHARRLALPGAGLLAGALTSGLAAAVAAGALVALPAARGSGHVGHIALAAKRPQGANPATPLAGARAVAASLTAQVQRAVVTSTGERQVPANLVPTLTHAVTDEAAPFFDGCFDSFTTTAVNPCNYGDTAAPKSIVLFGDSHALMWFPAFDNIANRGGWHLVAAAKATCPPLDIRVFSPDLDQWYTQCTQWRSAEVARIEALRPAVVVLGFSREYGVGNDHVVVGGRAWLHGLTAMVRTLRATGAEVVVLGDVPYPAGPVPQCLATHLADATACLIPRSPPDPDLAGIAAERAAVLAAGGAYVDTEPWFCGPRSCAVLVENMIVYRDDNHITATYATWLTPVIQADLAVATGLAVRPPDLAPRSTAAATREDPSRRS